MKRLALAVMLLLPAACATPALHSAESVERYVYRLGSGDRLRVTTFGEPSVSGEFAISGAGMIAFPLLGDVEASGKTTQELREALTTRLAAQFLRNPSVSIEVVNHRPVFILGEIEKPGEFVYSERMSAFALIAKAGGFTYRANRTVVFIRHENEVEEKAYALSPSLAVRPGDTIRIGERYF